MQQPHVYLGNSGLRLWCHTTIPSTTKKVSKDELKFGLSANHWGYLPNHCLHDLCLSRSFLMFFGANQVLGYLPDLSSWVKKVRPFKNHLQITGEDRINQTSSEHRHKAFGSNQGGFPKAPKHKGRRITFLKKMSIKISWSVSAPCCATT